MLMYIIDCIFEESGEIELGVSGDIHNIALRLDVREDLTCEN